MADIPESHFDKRTRERNIRRGLIKKADYEKYIEGLADAEDNAESIVVETDTDEGAEETVERAEG